jgi:GNAT superfamily N-acetyltransferase
MPPAISHRSLGRLVVGPVAPERTYALRQQVLRPHQRVEEMALPGADRPDAAVMAAVTDDGTVVATCAVTPEAAPRDLAAVLPPGGAWRLRAMATRPDVRSSGLGRAVLDAALDHVTRHGGGVLWCTARTPALRFYERAGFRTFGEPWIDEAIGPHVLAWRTVDSPGR